MKLYLAMSVYFVLAYGRTIPDYFPECKRADPKINKCILDGVEAIRPKLKTGIPEVNLPSLEPFTMKLLNVNSSITAATVKATITNIIAHGGANFKIEYFKVDLDNKYEADIKLIFPRLDVSADYDTRGSRLLLFTIEGSGKFKGTFSNVEVEAKCVASPIVKDGVEYLQLNSITTKVIIGKGELDVRPDENSLTERAATLFIHSSPSLVLRTLRPVIDETAAPIVKQYIDDVLSVVPIHEVLIDS